MAKIISFKKYPDLLCNHDGAQFVNDGYNVGYTSNNIPYEAELWHDHECLCLGVVLPYLKEFGNINTGVAAKKPLPKIINFHKAKEDKSNDTEGPDFSMLCVGMVDDGEEVELETIKNYVEFLVDEKIVEFVSNQYHGAVKYRVNEDGNSIVEVMIVLRKGTECYAISNLDYKKFPSNKHEGEIKVKMKLCEWKNQGFIACDIFAVVSKIELEKLSKILSPKILDAKTLDNKKFYLFINTKEKVLAPLETLAYAFGGGYNDNPPYGNELKDIELDFSGFAVKDEAFLVNMAREARVPSIIGFHMPDEKYGCFSNWYLADFEYAGKHFSSVEQFMMYHKVLMAENYDLAKEIMKTNDPARIKELASAKYFNDFDKIRAAWTKYSYTIVKRGVRAKFLQNSELRDILLDTDKALLVECSKSDKIWGNGININDSAWKDVRNWMGENKMGRILMELRNEFICMALLDKGWNYYDAYDAEAIYQWGLSPAELSRYPDYHNAIYAYVSTLSEQERNVFMNSKHSFADWEVAMRINMGGGLRIIGFYEMKQEIYDIADRLMI